jgi:hypothetical protein
MGTPQAIFAGVERGRATGSHVIRNHVTGRDASHGQSRDRKSYAISGLVGPRKWPIRTGSHMPSSGPVRKGSEVCSAHARVSRRFFLTSVVQVSWLPKVARRGERVCTCATRSCAKSALVGPFSQKWGFLALFLSTEGWEWSLRRMVTGTSHLRPIFNMVTGTSPGYLPLTRHFIFI